ncbi:MAG: hypothetical protein QOI74_1564 [Micromonosporaceae bacterium]|nr:hypothetical protein [Micromonosporaceae bacterium]
MPAEPVATPLSVSRRRLLALPAAAAAATVVAPLLGVDPAAGAGRSDTADRLVDRDLAGPASRGYAYLNTVQDAYVTGDELRLLQSYNNESGLMTTAFVYDNALAVIAYLALPTTGNVRRARLIGDALLFAQANDERFTDGRVRQAYAAGPMQFYGGGPVFTGLVRDDGKAAMMWPFGFSGSAVGDVAWTGLALVQLFAHTRIRRYLDGAVAAGTWIADKVSPYAHGGYHGGVQADGVTPQRWVSTEHNIDTDALFNLLATHTGDRNWRTRAAVARTFVRAMWNPAGRFFWTGTLGANPADDPNLINKAIIPEDVQTWARLDLRERRYDAATDWVVRTLSNTDGGAGSQLPAGLSISGVTFSDLSKVLTGTVPNGDTPNDRNAVWLEGNGHVAAALLDRDRGESDRRLARRLLGQTVVAQERLGAGQTVGLTSDPNGGRLSNPGEGGTWTGTTLPARSGVVAASSAFDTGFGFGYFQRQHVGATAWFLMAARAVNPYH